MLPRYLLQAMCAGLCVLIVGCASHFVEATFTSAQDDMRVGNYEGALPKLESVLNSPDASSGVRREAAVDLFQVYFYLDRYSECVEVYENHLRGDITRQQREYLIFAYDKIERYDEALKHIRTAKANVATDDNKELERLLSSEAVLYFKQGDYPRAGDAFARLYELTGGEGYRSASDMIERYLSGRDTNADGYRPIIVHRPEYPRRALNRGVEGYVTVKFDVNIAGATENISVVEAEPPGYFERAAVEAAEGLGFVPFLRNGMPVKREGVTRTFRFNIADTSEE